MYYFIQVINYRLTYANSVHLVFQQLQHVGYKLERAKFVFLLFLEVEL